MATKHAFGIDNGVVCVAPMAFCMRECNLRSGSKRCGKGTRRALHGASIG